MIPILAQGSEGLRKMAEGFANLSDAEIESVEQGHQAIEKAEAGLDKFFAMAIYGWTKVAQIIKNLPTGKELFSDLAHGINPIKDAIEKVQAADIRDMLEGGKKDKAQKAAAAAAAAQEENEKEYQRDLDAYSRYQQKKAEVEFKNKTPQQQLATLERQETDLWNEGELIDNEADLYDLLTDIEDTEGRILDIKKKIAEQQKQQNRIAEEAQLKIAQGELARLQAAKSKLVSELQSDAPSLQDFANSGYSVFRHNEWEFQQGPFAGIAQEILRLKADVKDSILGGDITRRDFDLSRIEELKKNLPDTEGNIFDPNGPFAGMNKNIGNLSDKVQAIVDQISKILPSFES
jgi:hypothetical protein